MAATGGPALHAEGVSFARGEEVVLSGLDLRVAPGELACLLGRNGAGKTTLLQVFLGFLRPDAGTVRVLGHDPTRDPAAARAQVAYVPESVSLYEHLSAAENLEYILCAGGRARPGDAGLHDALQRVGFPAHAVRAPARTYSKGMRQKVVLALALLRQARAVLLDEPTTGLDARAVADLAAICGELRRDGVALLAATHDLDWVRLAADRVAVLRDGRIGAQASGPDFDPSILAAPPVAAGAN